MKSIIISICLVFFILNNSFSNNKNTTNPVLKSVEYSSKSNYQYFSNILIYPLNVSKEINIKNSGNKFFKVSIYDENMALVMSFNSSPFCSTAIIMDSFVRGKYTINVSSDDETHQFNFYKKE